jgi:hypothetical protein
MLYVGHATGTTIGAILLEQGHGSIIGFVGASITGCGLALSLLGYYRWRI